jgi:hypothetical protein
MTLIEQMNADMKGMCHTERSRGVGVPARPSAPLCCAQDVAVALYVPSPRSFLAAGFPLRSLTRILRIILQESWILHYCITEDVLMTHP